MLYRKILIVGTLVIEIMAGCATRLPHINKNKLQGAFFAASQDSTSRWALDTLKPAEEPALIQGFTIPVSIRFDASGNGNYELGLSANGKGFRPFKLEILQGPGVADFSGTISWFLKVKGKKETENVTVSLFGIQKTATGKTEIKTLLKQFNRKYDVVCDKKTWRLLLFIKRHLGLCSCKLQ